MLISGLISAVYSTLNSSQKFDFGMILFQSVEERKTNIKHWSKYSEKKR